MPQISIRYPEPGDAGAIAAAVRESLDDLLPWMIWATPEYGEGHAATWIGQQARARELERGFEFVIVNPEGRILGSCGINQINPVFRFANLGYWVRSSEAGKGVATAAVRELQQWTFSNTNLERLEIVISLGNRRSERVAEKVGAFREGVLKSRLIMQGVFHDATMFSLIRPFRPPDSGTLVS